MKTLRSILVGFTLMFCIVGMANSANSGGTLSFGRFSDSLLLDPVLNDSNQDIWMLNNLYETLLFPSKDSKSLEPGLATKWHMSEDGKILTLIIRSGVKFADGTPLHTSDVKWSLDRARNPKNGLWNVFLKAVSSVQLKGDDEVVIRLQQPDPTILAVLATFNTSIMPEKLFKAEPGETDREKATAFAQHPVGTGPFILTEWARNSKMILKRNPYYWGKDPKGKPLPYLDKLEFETIPDDATRILKLRAGELDIIAAVPFARVSELKADPKINMVLFPSTRIYSLVMNNRDKTSDGRPNPMHDVRVRQAMNYAIDKNALLKVVFFGAGNPAGSFIPSSTPFSIGSGSAAYPYDSARAKKLMTEAGYSGGFNVSIMVIGGSADNIQLATTVQEMWSKIGIKLKIDLVDHATRTSLYRSGKFEMRIVRWVNDINDPGHVISYFAYSPTIDSFHSGYKDVKVEELYLMSQKEVDSQKRAKLFRTLQERYIKAAPIMFLVETPLTIAMGADVKGFVQSPLGDYVLRETFIDK